MLILGLIGKYLTSKTIRGGTYLTPHDIGCQKGYEIKSNLPCQGMDNEQLLMRVGPGRTLRKWRMW